LKLKQFILFSCSFLQIKVQRSVETNKKCTDACRVNLVYHDYNRQVLIKGQKKWWEMCSAWSLKFSTLLHNTLKPMYQLDHSLCIIQCSIWFNLL